MNVEKIHNVHPDALPGICYKVGSHIPRYYKM